MSVPENAQATLRQFSIHSHVLSAPDGIAPNLAAQESLESLPTGNWRIHISNGNAGTLRIDSVASSGRVTGSAFSKPIEGYWDPESRKFTFLRQSRTNRWNDTSTYAGYLYVFPPGETINQVLAGTFEELSAAELCTFGWYATLSTQQVAIPSYFRPGANWDTLDSAGHPVALAIINPDSGPGDTPSQTYADQVVKSQAAGLTVLGYTWSDYGQRALADVEEAIDNHFAWYGVNGIFIDEAANVDDASTIDYYLHLHDYIKNLDSNGTVVINPGTSTKEGYMSTADIVVNFEGTFDTYCRRHLPDTSWEWQYPADRFWHMVHTTSENEMPVAVSLSKTRNAGWVYVTSDVMNNPWDTLPSGTYWNAFLAAVADS